MPDTTSALRAIPFINAHWTAPLLSSSPPLALLPPSFPPPSRPLSAVWQVWLGGRVFPLFISEKMDSGKRLLKPLPTLPQLMGVIHLCPFLPDKALLED